MAETKQIFVPDIGNFKDVNVIEVLVKAGDTVKAEDGLITLETDKAAMDVPSPSAGVVREMKVKAGDKVSQGSVILLLVVKIPLDYRLYLFPYHYLPFYFPPHNLIRLCEI